MEKAILGVLIVSLSTPVVLSQLNLFKGVMNQVTQIHEIMEWGVQEASTISGIAL